MVKTESNQSLTTRELLSVYTRCGLETMNHELLKVWHRRGVISSGPSGKGRERRYTFQEAAFIAALSFLSLHMRYGGLNEAQPLARVLADTILAVDGGIDPGTAGYVFVYEQGRPIFQRIDDGDVRFKTISKAFGFREALIVDPAQMALQLRFAFNRAIKERE